MKDVEEEGRRIALFGIFRSGTNYFRTVMEWNYKVRMVTDEFGWKHGYYPIITTNSKVDYPNLDVVFVTKNPFSAIASLFRYYTDNGRNIIAAKEWKQFIRQRFVVYDYFQEFSPQYRFLNIVEFWNSMNWNYLSIRRPGIRSIHVRYEDMLDEPVVESARVAEKLELFAQHSKKGEFRVPQRVTRNMGDRARSIDDDYLTGTEFTSRRYSGKEYMSQFDESDVQFVMQQLDSMLVDQLGYAEVVSDLLSLVTGD